MKKIAVFGAGRIGQVHATNITKNSNAKLACVYDVFPQAAQALAHACGTHVAASPDEIWHSNVDAVVIASPTDTHADLLMTAMDAGKAVYCEKPIDLDIQRVQSVIEKSHGFSHPVFLGFSRRFDANHRAVQEAVAAGDIGKIELLHITGRDTTPPPLQYVQTSGGQLRDQSIHFFDMLAWITGDIPIEVYAAGTSLVDAMIGAAGDTDTVMVTVTMQSGALAHINNSRRSVYAYDERIEVFGSGGMIQSRQKPVREVSVYTDTSKIISDGPHTGWFERMKETFEIAMNTFIQVLDGEKQDYPTLMDGLRAQLLAEAAARSLQEKKPVTVQSW